MRTRSTARSFGLTALRVPLVCGIALVSTAPAFAEGPERAARSAPPASARTQVQGIEVRDGGRQVVIDASATPTFSLFRMTEPFRVLVDVSGAELGPQIGKVTRGAGVVKAVTPSSFDDGRRSIARVEIELHRATGYEARVRGNSIVVDLADSKGAPGDRTATTQAGSFDRDSVQAAEIGRLRVSRRSPRTVLRAPVSGAELSSDAVHMETLSSPARLVVDLDGARLSPKWQRLRVGQHGVRRARAAVRGEGVRIVLDLEPSADFPKVAVDVVDGFIDIGIEAPAVPKPQPVAEVEPAPVARPSVAKRAKPTTKTAAPPVRAEAVRPAPIRNDYAAAAAAPAKAQAPSHRVKNVRFEPKDGFYRLTVRLTGKAKDAQIVRRGSESAPTLRISNVRLPENLERTMDVSAVAGETLSSISTFNEDGDLVIAARILEQTEHRHWRKKDKLMWDFRSVKPRVLTYEEEGTASYASEAARTAGTLAPRRQQYTGRRISTDLKDADIQNVLRLLADVSKLNIVAGEEVKGKITIKLRNVPWDQALDIILQAKQLDKTRNGNIIRVAPLTVLRKEEELRLARAKAKIQLEPLTVRLIPVSYAVAADVAPQVRALLTKRGDVNIDQRTNVLIVEDIQDVLTKVERLVRTLDTQTPQVLIEARIVEARSNFSRELGIQWGGNASFTQNFGNQTGLSFPSNVRIAGGADDQQSQVTEGVLPNANYAVNLPATVGSGGGGALGFVFGSLNGGTLVNLRLSAAEATGKVKIVSAPKIVTLDNKEAKILSGERIPIDRTRTRWP